MIFDVTDAPAVQAAARQVREQLNGETLFVNTDYFEAGTRLLKYMVRGGRKGYPPEKVGEVVLHTLTTPRPRIRYAVIRMNSWRRILQTFLPRRVMDRIIARYLGLVKSS